MCGATAGAHSLRKGKEPVQRVDLSLEEGNKVGFICLVLCW